MKKVFTLALVFFTNLEYTLAYATFPKDQERENFRIEKSNLTFELKVNPIGWKVAPQTSDGLLLVARPPWKEKVFLTVRHHTNAIKDSSFNYYIRLWTRRMPKFGIDVISKNVNEESKDAEFYLKSKSKGTFSIQKILSFDKDILLISCHYPINKGELHKEECKRAVNLAIIY